MHNKAFDYKFSKSKKPFLRLIAVQAMKAISGARTMEWIEGEEIEQSRARAIQLARYSLGAEEKSKFIMEAFFKSS